jgi:adenine phosphoribosyltransferase
MDLAGKLRHVLDFPTPGIDFVDITTLLQDAAAYKEAFEAMCGAAVRFGPFDCVVSPEARGFVFGAPLALRLGKGFVPARKAGKLPAELISYEYKLEYGLAKIEMHADAVAPGGAALIVDDLLATGGTGLAIAHLIEKMGGRVAGYLAFIELAYLDGAAQLGGLRCESVLKINK